MFGVVVRYFERSTERQTRDGAILAELLDSVLVAEGQEWSLLKPTATGEFEWISGTVTTLLPDKFKVQIPSGVGNSRSVAEEWITGNVVLFVVNRVDGFCQEDAPANRVAKHQL